MLSEFLVTTLLFALCVTANPVARVPNSRFTLPLARRINATSVRNLLKHDLQRVAALKARAKRAQGVELTLHEEAIVNEAIDNQAVGYIASVGVGSPPTNYELIVDTGSANTWVGATTPYVITSSSVQTNNRMSVTYGFGSFSGVEFTDTVTLGSLVLAQQSIGVANRARNGWHPGVCAIITCNTHVLTIPSIGPVDLTLGTLSPATNTLIPTVTDNLFSRGLINSNEIGISFEPTQSLEVLNGELTWGGVDSSKLTGSVVFTPITTSSPSNKFWGINQSVRYGTTTTILANTVGIVDAGTTFILLATDAIARYKQLIGAPIDVGTGFLRLTAAQFAGLRSLFFTIGGRTYELTANAQIWPRALNTAIGGTAGNIYLIIGDLGTPSGEGLDFVSGYAFLERFYSVFDTTNRRVGFATTPFTTATTN